MTQINVTAAGTISGTAATLGNGFAVVIYNASAGTVTAPGSYSIPTGSAIFMTGNGSSFHHFPLALGQISVNGITSNGPVGITNGGIGVVGGVTVTLGDVAISAGALSVTAASGNSKFRTINGPTLWEWGTKTDGTGYVFTSAAKSFVIETGNASILTANTTGVYPTVDNSRQLGLATNRWSVVYAVNGVIQTSDKRQKTHVAYVSEGEAGAIVDALKPTWFTWSDGTRDIGHYAQDVASILPEACEVPKTDEDFWGLKPDRIIPVLVAEIQALRRRVTQLEASC
jgi:hypothetical protein